MSKVCWFFLVSIGIVVVVDVTILGKYIVLAMFVVVELWIADYEMFLVRIWLMGLVYGMFLLNILFIYPYFTSLSCLQLVLVGGFFNMMVF